MKLSILIASLESRADLLSDLLHEFDAQGAGHRGQYEVITDVDDGTMPIGQKRQRLLERAKGDFITFHDDDDEPAPEYLDGILAACRDGVDCIGYRIACYGYSRRGPYVMELADVSNRYDRWAENVGGFRYVRCPHHLVPVRREHALAVGFDGSSKYGEDAAYSYGLRDAGLLKVEAYIPQVMYTIHHNPKKVFGRQ